MVSKFLNVVLAVSMISLFFTHKQASAAGWSLNYGNGENQLGYYNSTVNPKLEEASGLGPMSFRIHGADAWITDSIGGRILCVAPDGKNKLTILVPQAPANTLIEDIALESGTDGKPAFVWAADGADGTIKKLRIPEGGEVLRVGGQGNEPGKFVQISRLEVGKSGRLYVGDIGRKVVAVFDVSGKLEREYPWEGSGFCLDSKERLCLLSFSEAVGHVCRKFNTDGILAEVIHLGQPFAQNPKVWWSDENDSITVSYIPQGGFRGSLALISYDKFGAVTAESSVKPPKGMNRFLDKSETSIPSETFQIWKAEADFDTAPQGRFQIVVFPPEGDK